MAHIPLIEPGEGSDQQNEFLEAVPPINLFKLLAHTPDKAMHIAQLGGQILYSSSLDPKLRELAILRAAHCVGCKYEVVHHERIGLDVGLSEKQLAAVKLDEDRSGFDENTEFAISCTDEIVAQGSLGSDKMSDLVKRFGEVGSLEFVTCVSYYLMVASILMSFDVEVEGAGFSQGVKIDQKPESLG